jgi:replication factor C small subunit
MTVEQTPLWLKSYSPSADDIIQQDVVETLLALAELRSNCFLYGPAGVGKTALLKTLFENETTAVSWIYASDLFELSKSDLVGSIRWGETVSEVGERASRRELLVKRIKKVVSTRTVFDSGRTVIIEGVDLADRGTQQALRRVIEKNCGVQFILVGRDAGKLLSPLRSRCPPVPVRKPSDSEVVNTLEQVSVKEGVEVTDNSLELLADKSDGNIRYSLLAFQSATSDGRCDLPEGGGFLKPSEKHCRAILDAARSGDLQDARSEACSYLSQPGGSPQQLCVMLLETVHTLHCSSISQALVRQFAPVGPTVPSEGLQLAGVMQLLSLYAETVTSQIE